MSARELITRSSLRTALVVNAATKPIALAVGAAVAAAAILLGVGWLLFAAGALYLALAATTFFDEQEAERVGRRAYDRARAGRRRPQQALPSGLPAEIVLLFENVRAEQRRIDEVLDELDLPFAELRTEIDQLTAEMERIAPRAQVVHRYLVEQRPEDVRRRLAAIERDGINDGTRARVATALRDQLRVHDALRAELTRFEDELEHLVASLGAVRGELVRMGVAGDEQGRESIANDLHELRGRVAAVSAGVRDAASRIG